MPKFIDRTGSTYSRLTYLRFVGKNKFKQSLWEARCSCGNLVPEVQHGCAESCGCLFVERNHAPKPHSPEHCQKISEARRIKNTEHICPVCGAKFLGTKTQRFCSMYPCQKKFFDSRNGLSRAKALCLKFGGRYTAVAFWKVYVRDVSLCQVCGAVAPQELRGDKHNMLAPTLGHIIPLARGGDHTYENVQLEHLGCNLKKGSDLPEGVVEPRTNPDPRTRLEKIREETRKAMQRPEVKEKMSKARPSMQGRKRPEHSAFMTASWALRKSQSAITSPQV
jgi:5-methylcytosine-specific restriction endonuclease McrA